jgi:Zn-dependent peptidase ImmA (M78 family)/DNA-binding XRE family transcriptional regulator
MAKSIPAIVTPGVLRWARELDKFTIDEISAKLNVQTERMQEWENGSEYPTLKQAKDLAKYCRVPFVYFYLPDIPKKTKRLDKVDYRTFGNYGDELFMSRELRWLLRDIEDRRDTMLELYTADEKIPSDFPVHLPASSSEQQIADTIRSLLDLTPAIQRTFRKADNALSYCVTKLEEKDLLVFQAAKIAPHEMRGLSIAYDTFPIIVLNRKDESSARLFTLCHELTHIITRSSGICNDVSEQSDTQNNMEIFCNKVAGLALVPEPEFKSHQCIASIKKYGLDDTYVNAIARDFAVSKEVIIHRLWSIGVITKKQYFDTLHRYTDEYLTYKRKKPKGFLPPAMDKGTQVGKLYARTVISSYYNEKISIRDASGYLLNLGAQHLGKVERWCY